MLFVFLVLSYLELIEDLTNTDRAGLLSFYRYVADQRCYRRYETLSFSMFGQKRFFDIFGIRLDIPSGFLDGKYVLSDAIANLRINPYEIFLNPSLGLAVVFPTGTTPATSERVVISSFFSLNPTISEDLSIAVMIGGNFSPNKKLTTYNRMFPHTFDEVLVSMGFAYEVFREIVTQLSFFVFYENFRDLGFQVIFRGNLDTKEFRFSPLLFLAFGRTCRRGYGIGLLLSRLF